MYNHINKEIIKGLLGGTHGGKTGDIHWDTEYLGVGSIWVVGRKVSIKCRKVKDK